MKGTLSDLQGTLRLVEEKEPQTVILCAKTGKTSGATEQYTPFSPSLDLSFWQSMAALGRRSFYLLSHSNSFGARGLSSQRPSYFPMSWST